VNPDATFHGRVDLQGRLLMAHQERRRHDARIVALTGKNVVVTVAEEKSTRSDRANAYLWGVVYRFMAEDQCGKDSEEAKQAIHDAMCERFLPNQRKQVEFFSKLTGETLTIDTDPRRSSRLTGEPFYDFVEDVRQFALDFMGVVTPDPDPEYWRKRTTREPLNEVGSDPAVSAEASRA
jgi:hypothetical protein